MSRNRIAVIVLWCLSLLAVVLFLSWRFAEPGAGGGVMTSLGKGDYRLQTTEGEAFTEESLEGSPSAVFFGFTHCPDVCPTTLGDIVQWQADLVPEGETLRAFLVTVDPERDDLQALRDYVSWVPGVVGVTGDPAEVEKAIEAFKVFAQKRQLEGGGYSVDHSSSVLLFDEDGRFFEPVGYREDLARVEAKLARLFEN